jgi:hypothetical protein
MDKIMEVALTGKFGADAVPSIMDVISNTPNAIMAAEILLGVYAPHELAAVTNDKKVRTLISADEWTTSVKFSYEEKVTKTIYVADSLDTSVITIDNYKEFEIPYSKGNAKYFSIETGEIRTRTDACDISQWIYWTEQTSKEESTL